MTSLPFPIAQTSTSDPYERCRHAAMGMSALCTLAPQTLLHDSVASIFQSCAVPKMSLAKYAVYIAARCSHGEEAVLLGLVLMARYCRTVNQMPTAYTEHRLLLAAIVVGSKAHYDDFYKNVYMARIGGVGPKELVQLEWALIEGLQGSCLARAAEVRDLLYPLCDFGKQLASGAASVATVGRLASMVVNDVLRPNPPYSAPSPMQPMSVASMLSPPRAPQLGRLQQLPRTPEESVVNTGRSSIFQPESCMLDHSVVTEYNDAVSLGNSTTTVPRRKSPQRAATIAALPLFATTHGSTLMASTPVPPQHTPSYQPQGLL